ncbi:MAG: hypothetical protein K9G67_01895 [Bacteroidales bacterium]|nr:hypothetical protein [Bacteroidales bacterium]MCF8375083.1 hypothetical protein [Bacteroidales bacterium]
MDVSNEQKKTDERIILDYFRQCYPDFPGGKLIESESPDFIVETSRKRSLGIELTKLHDPEAPDPGFDKNSYDVRKLDQQMIEGIIRVKEEKLAIYNKQMNDLYWLIIFIDQFDGPESFNIKNKIGKWNIHSSFNKVFLFEMFSPDIYIFI